MANGKAKKGKGILDNQQVNPKGRASSRNKTKLQTDRHSSFIRPAGGHLRYLVALVLLGACVGLTAALVSGFGHSGADASNANLLGTVGSAAADNLFGALGLAAFVVPIWLGFIALRLFVRAMRGLRLRQWLGLLMAIVGGMVVADLTGGATASGSIGATLGSALRAPLSSFGEALVAAMLIGAGLILVTRSAIIRWILAFFGLCAAGGMALGAALKRLLAAAWSWGEEQREIWQREREEEEERYEQEMAELEAAEAERLEALARDASLAPQSAAPSSIRPGTKLVIESDIPASIAPESAAPTDACGEPSHPEIAQASALPDAADMPAPEEPASLPPDIAPPDDFFVSLPPQEAVPSEPEPCPAPERPALVISAAPAPTPEPDRDEDDALASSEVESAFFDAPIPQSTPASAPTPEPTPTPLPEPPPRPAPSDKRADKPAPVKPQIFEPTVLPRPAAVPPQKRDPFAFEGQANFCLPSLELLAEPRASAREPLDKDACYKTAERLVEKLKTFNIPGTVKRILPGPVVTMYEFEPGPGIKISKISGLADDLAMAMEALSVRIIAPLPGRGVVGIEVPNKKREMICLREIFEQPLFQKATSKLAFAIGKDVEGTPYMTDLAKMPHLLIAGTTGSGKSVTVNTMIMSMLYKATPEEVRLIMVDPKVTELSIYEGIPHLLLPVVTDPKKAALALQWAVEEMERRYQLLAGASVRNITGYNAWVEKRQAEIEAQKRAAAEAAREQEARKKAAQAGQAAPGVQAGEIVASQTADPQRRVRIIDVQEGESTEAAYARAMEADSQDPSQAVTEPPNAADASYLPSPAPALDKDDEPEDRRIDEEALELDARDAYEAEIARFMEEKASAPPQKLPYIVIIIDEVADLMMVVRNEVETQVARLAQKARAAGIHLMLATQRPSADIITGVIKANFPSRISCQLRSWQDSMTILGSKGAEALLGMGDMLILPPTSPNLQRVHGAFVSDEEIGRVVEFLRTQGTPIYDESILRPRDEDGEDGEESGGGGDRDAMYDTCLALVSEMKTVSTSMLQRKLKLGYNRAARIIEQMEREGIVGPANGSKPREVLIRPIGENYKEVNL